MKLRHTLAALAATTLVSNAAIIATLDSSAFTDQYNGDQIWNSAYLNNWDDAGAPVNESLNGTVLTVSHSGNTGWIQQDNGASNWETQLTSTSAWTAEVQLNVNDGVDANDNVVSLWFANEANTIILNVAESGIGTFNNNSNLSATANSGIVTVRVAYDDIDGDFSVWRDGTLLTETQAANFTDGGDRLIIGDCCSSVSSTGGDIHYVRYDTTGAFAPVPDPIPEPSSTALLGLAGLALLARRRK